jgi:hypothetical protein
VRGERERERRGEGEAEGFERQTTAHILTLPSARPPSFPPSFPPSIPPSLPAARTPQKSKGTHIMRGMGMSLLAQTKPPP